MRKGRARTALNACPAKLLLGTRVIREDGTVASLRWMLIRDLAVRVIAFGAVDRAL